MAKKFDEGCLPRSEMGSRFSRCLSLRFSVFCKFLFFFIVFSVHYGICQSKDIPHKTVDTLEKDESSKFTKSSLLSSQEADTSMAQDSVERAKSILGITDSHKEETPLEPVYKVQDTKRILSSIKNEFLTRQAVPTVSFATESHPAEESSKDKEPSENLRETTSDQLHKVPGQLNQMDSEKIEPQKIELENKMFAQEGNILEEESPLLEEKESSRKEKFIEHTNEDNFHDVIMEAKMHYEGDKHLKETEKEKTVMPKKTLQQKILELHEKVSDSHPDIVHKTEAHAVAEESLLSSNGDNYVKDKEDQKSRTVLESSELEKEIGGDVDRPEMVETEEHETLEKTLEGNSEGVRPTGSNLEVEREVLSVIEGRSDDVVNVTINPARVLDDKQKLTYSVDGTLSHFIDAREFFTSISTKNFTPIGKQRETTFTGSVGLEKEESRQKYVPKSTEELSQSVGDTLKETEVKDDSSTVIQTDDSGEVRESQKEVKEEREEVEQEVKAVIGEDSKVDTVETSQEDQIKEPIVKGDGIDVSVVDKGVEKVDISDAHSESEIMKKKDSDEPSEINDTVGVADDPQKDSHKPPKFHQVVSDSVEEEKIKDDKMITVEKLVEETDVKEKEPTVTKKVGAEPEAPQTEQQESDASKKVKPSPDIDAEVEKDETPSDSVTPEEDSEKAKKISDSKKKKGAEDTEEKPPETIEGLAEQEAGEKTPDTLETYSQFTQRVNAEKKNDVIANSHGGNGHGKGPKVKSKNYASPDCGSKLLTANPEATHASKVIQSNRDEYLLNKCRDKTWFTIELCESIRPQMFDIANFELFSNLPKDIHVFGSHRYPTRDWTSLSRVMGQEANRGVQSFPITTDDFFKYIKVEVLSHYGSEFFCPISLFRIYGLSEFEVIDTIEDSPEDQDDGEEAFTDSFEEDARKKSKDEGKPSGVIPAVLKNMFSGVLDVIKRGYRPTSSSSEPDEHCHSLQPRHAVDSSRCPMAESLNYILSCYWTEYEDLMLKPFVSSTVKNSSFCRQLASTMCTEPVVNDSVVYDTVCNNSYVCVMLSPKHVLAMCFMHDNRIMDTEMACDSISSHVSENFSATSSDIVSHTNGIPDYVKNGEINTSSITRADAIDTENGVMGDIQGIKLAQEKEGGQILVEQKAENESVMPATLESSTSETPKVQKKSKAGSNGHQDKHMKESDLKDNITEPEENVEVEVSGFGGIELEEEEFPHGEELTTPTPAPVTPPHTEPKVLSSAPTNKESVVVRLSNKIKALEYNMSISSQYLEELSRRYKRQMEEMQRQFNLTIAALNATSRQAFERDQHHQRDIEKLEQHLASVSNILDKLVEERETLAHTVVEQHLLLMVVEVLVLCVVFAICNRRTNHHMDNALSQDRPAQTPSEDHTDSPVHQDSGSHFSDGRGRSRVRRRSVDSITRERASHQRQRRPSEEALKISGTYQDLLIIEPTIPIWMDSVSDRKKKKKSNHGTLKRSKSNASIVEKSSSSRKSHRIEKLNTSSAGVLFYGDCTVTKDPTPPLSSSVSSPDSPDFSGFPYEPFVNEQELEFCDTGGGHDTCVTRSYVEASPDGYFPNDTNIVNSKRHSIACFHNCDSLHKKGTKLFKSLSVSSAPEKLKISGEKVKKLKKVKIKNNVNENLHQLPVALDDHDYYYPKTGRTSYSCQDEHYGEYYYNGHTNVHFSEDTNGPGNHDFCYQGDAPYTDSFVNGDSSCATDYNIGNDYIHNNHDKSLNDKRKLSHKTKVKVKLRSDNWEWYSAQHFGGSSSETVSTCSDSSGKNKKVKTEEKSGTLEKTEEKRVKKKKKSKTKSPVLLEEEAIPEGDAGT